MIFGADMSSYVHVDNKGKDILILDEGPTQGLDDTKLKIEAKYALCLGNVSRDLTIYNMKKQD